VTINDKKNVNEQYSLLFNYLICLNCNVHIMAMLENKDTVTLAYLVIRVQGQDFIFVCFCKKSVLFTKTPFI